MGRYFGKIIGLCSILYLIMAVSCQKTSKPELTEFINVYIIPDSLATPEQLEEKAKIIGFFYNEKVSQFRNGKIKLIADSSLFDKNNVDIRYMSFFMREIEETNKAYAQMLKNGIIPKDSFPKLIEDAFCEAQRIHAQEIVE